MTKRETDLPGRGGRPFGISIGTAYSSICTADPNGRPVPIRIPLERSERLASAIWFGPAGTIAVGETARGMESVEPECVADNLPFLLARDEAFIAPDGTAYDPGSLMTILIKKLVQTAAEQGYEVDRAVLSCPIDSDGQMRDALLRAGRAAGPDVSELIYEPAAAILRYLLPDLLNGAGRGRSTVLVFDLGGAHFTLSLAAVEHTDDLLSIRLLQNDGDRYLGGCWQYDLTGLLLERCRREFGPDPDQSDPELAAIIQPHVEQAMKALSVRTETSCLISYRGTCRRVTVTREEFEAATSARLAICIDFVERLLANAGLPASAVDAVLLVGGVSRLPQIAEALDRLFPGRVLCGRPELAIAEGTALYANRQSLFREKILTEPRPLDDPGGACHNR